MTTSTSPTLSFTAGRASPVRPPPQCYSEQRPHCALIFPSRSFSVSIDILSSGATTNILCDFGMPIIFGSARFNCRVCVLVNVLAYLSHSPRTYASAVTTLALAALL